MINGHWSEIENVIDFFFCVFHSSGFFPVAVNFLRRVPILGRFLELPGIRGVSAFAKYFAPPPSSKRFFFLRCLFCFVHLQVVDKVTGDSERTRV